MTRSQTKCIVQFVPSWGRLLLIFGDDRIRTFRSIPTVPAIYMERDIYEALRSLNVSFFLVCSVVVLPASKNPVEALYDLFVNVALVWTETACKGFWDV
jgi:hypothetical protein